MKEQLEYNNLTENYNKYLNVNKGLFCLETKICKAIK